MITADALAQAALPGFFAGLGAVCAGAALAWRHPRRPGVAGPWGVTATAVGAALLFALLAPGPGGTVAHWDLALSDAIGATLPPMAVAAFGWVSALGNTPTLTAIALLVGAWLLLRRRWALAAGWMLAVLGNPVLNTGLKLWFARARPLHARELAHADGFSFPSGHASGAVVVYGMLACVLLLDGGPRWRGTRLQEATVVLAAALAFATGCSRVFLRAHFPSDVAAGFASGAAWLMLCIWLTRRSLSIR